MDKERIKKTGRYLNDLGDRKRRINILKKEIAILKESEKYSEINFNELGFKIKTSPKGLDDMIINSEQQILLKESEIEYIEKRLKIVYSYMQELESDEREIIRLRYFYDINNKMTMTKIASQVNCCRWNVYRKLDNALWKLSGMLSIF
ncbi:RNA polymerase sigma factor, sigma-70 family [Clostridioides difficile]|uniref:sigma-70 family RNA polymerase sigma factor n=1 Tax=Clostridioides difficile TaxID=1496 RepID=UPI0009A93CED|nr:sigma-70 family RNA polymerase sigma factor [Clostridioides difficile]EGT3656559.1 sigma-70 family RNA polymerase sigma factor [Clostridioides difficile]EGT3939397.1 sigma-70 family RNA polymerase sigma factor [Clostridioides difficile]EGT5145560.1 sigma-70 family RNA polymerase sigma factor [Clostridioides difficile]EIS9859171.1 sigma-70 family RNA polymerase sigma factor [Clostridioides difficile]MBH7225048.1 sigma-70 family RNA polymerase sigma factor [Clostridioides difficile]